jgi:heavy metal efflux system protein
VAAGFHQNKDELIAAMNRELEKMPGVVWGFSSRSPTTWKKRSAESRDSLPPRSTATTCRTFSRRKADQIVNVMRKVKGIEDLGVFRVLGQPNDNFIVDRQQAARYQINVADVQDAIKTAAGGNALTQVLQGEARYDLVMRYLPQFRNTKEAIENIRLLAPTGERVSLAQLCKSKSGTALRNLPRRQPALCRDQVQRARPRSGRRGRRSHRRR